MLWDWTLELLKENWHHPKQLCSLNTLKADQPVVILAMLWWSVYCISCRTYLFWPYSCSELHSKIHILFLIETQKVTKDNWTFFKSNSKQLDYSKTISKHAEDWKSSECRLWRNVQVLSNRLSYICKELKKICHCNGRILNITVIQL